MREYRTRLIVFAIEKVQTLGSAFFLFDLWVETCKENEM